MFSSQYLNTLNAIQNNHMEVCFRYEIIHKNVIASYLAIFTIMIKKLQIQTRPNCELYTRNCKIKSLNCLFFYLFFLFSVSSTQQSTSLGKQLWKCVTALFVCGALLLSVRLRQKAPPSEQLPPLAWRSREILSLLIRVPLLRGHNVSVAPVLPAEVKPLQQVDSVLLWAHTVWRIFLLEIRSHSHILEDQQGSYSKPAAQLRVYADSKHLLCRIRRQTFRNSRHDLYIPH